MMLEKVPFLLFTQIWIFGVAFTLTKGFLAGKLLLEKVDGNELAMGRTLDLTQKNAGLYFLGVYTATHHRIIKVVKH